MIRRVSVLALAAALGATPLSAQGPQFTVSAASADVYKFPTTASPVIGHAPRGTALGVVRDLGSWVRVQWPGGEDGVAYVHVSTGSIARPIAPSQDKPAAATPGAAAGTALPTAIGGAVDSNQRPVSAAPRSPLPTTYVQPPTHSLGIGAKVGFSNAEFGASARAWSPRRVGIQLEVSRAALTGTSVPGRMTSLQFAPSVLVTSGEHVTDNASLRPYGGAGASLSLQSLDNQAEGGSSSDHGFGFQAFGGVEVTLAGLPQFAMSGDVGYRRLGTSFEGFDLTGFTMGISGHWYFR